MITNDRKALLIYKKSAYSIYFMDRKIKLAAGGKADLNNEMRRFQRAHEEHCTALKEVERILCAYGIRYDKYLRGRRINYARYNLIITVGGDGTFLEASRKVKDQAIIGVNSTPSFSVGKLCTVYVNNFERIIQRAISKKPKFSLWQRLRLNLDGHVRPVDCINDVLICHSNPAAMSRYYLQIGPVKEEHRSSGLWIAAPAGSSGAIRSAGGRLLNPTDKKIQYMPRELYYGFCRRYRHTGGVLERGQKLRITSLMRSGMIFVDGTHVKFDFPFNATLKVTLSPRPLKVIMLK